MNTIKNNKKLDDNKNDENENDVDDENNIDNNAIQLSFYNSITIIMTPTTNTNNTNDDNILIHKVFNLLDRNHNGYI